MATPIYPALVTLAKPGPTGTPIDITDPTTPQSVQLSNGGAAASAANPVPVQQSVGNAVISDTNPQPTKGVAFKSTVTVTRPANTTAYTAGDVIGDTGGSAILTFASIGLTAGHILLTGLMLEIDITAIPSGMAAFRLHLYDAEPDAIADNAAWDLSSAGDRGKYLGYIDIAAPVDLGSTLIALEERVNIHRKLAAASTTIYGLLQTLAGFTPAANSEVYKVTLRSTQLG